MIVPLWAPFALLTAVCAVCPRPAWTRRVDWPFTGFWVAYLACYGGALGFLIWWAVS